MDVPPLFSLANDGCDAAQDAFAFCVLLLVAVKDLSADTETMPIADGGDF